MHNLITNISKFRNLISDYYGADNLTNGNFRHYTNQPKALDVKIIALTLAAETQGIISENNLFQILQSYYQIYRQTLPD